MHDRNNMRKPAETLRASRLPSLGFTLVEMLVVVGMLGVLMAVSFSGVGQARKQAKIAKANSETRELINAWLAYEAAHDDWPVEITGDEIIADQGALGELLGENEEQAVYLNANLTGGVFLDPWGNPYRLRLLYETQQNPKTDEFPASVTFPNRHRR